MSLFETTVGAVVLEGCGTCGGIWLDNAGTRAVTQHAVPNVSAIADQAERHATTRPDQRPPAACPVCRTNLDRVREPRSGVELDVCTRHGTWFDANELHRVARAYDVAPQPAPVAPDFRPLAPSEVPDFRAGANTEGLVTAGIGILGVLGTILSVMGNSRDTRRPEATCLLRSPWIGESSTQRVM